MVDYLLGRVGCPYEDQATGPDTFSCTGLVCYGLRAWGLIPSSRHLTEEGLLAEFAHFRLPPSVQPLAGDVLLFGKKELTHAAVAIDSWRMVESSNGGQDTGVRIRPISSRGDLEHVLRIPL